MHKAIKQSSVEYELIQNCLRVESRQRTIWEQLYTVCPPAMFSERQFTINGDGKSFPLASTLLVGNTKNTRNSKWTPPRVFSCKYGDQLLLGNMKTSD